MSSPAPVAESPLAGRQGGGTRLAVAHPPAASAAIAPLAVERPAGGSHVPLTDTRPHRSVASTAAAPGRPTAERWPLPAYPPTTASARPSCTQSTGGRMGSPRWRTRETG